MANGEKYRQSGLYKHLFGPISDWLDGDGTLFGNLIKANGLGEVVENLEKSFAGTGMTDKAKEEVDYSMAAQSEFYEKYQSWPAQVQQVQQAGLNPMILANNSGVSATSAPSSSSGGSVNPLALVSLLVNLSLRKKEIDLEDRRVSVLEAQSPSIIHRNEAGAGLSEANVQKIKDLIDLQKENLTAATNLLKQQISNKEVEERLAEANISKSKADAALSIRQEALFAIQEKYGPKYWDNLTKLQELQADLVDAQTSQNHVAASHLRQQIVNLQTENDNLRNEGIGIILENGKCAHQLEILGYEAANAPKRIKQENRSRTVSNIANSVGIVTDIVGTAATAASGYGAVVSAGASVMRANTYQGLAEHSYNNPLPSRYGYSVGW